MDLVVVLKHILLPQRTAKIRSTAAVAALTKKNKAHNDDSFLRERRKQHDLGGQFPRKTILLQLL